MKRMCLVFAMSCLLGLAPVVFGMDIPNKLAVIYLSSAEKDYGTDDSKTLQNLSLEGCLLADKTITCRIKFDKEKAAIKTVMHKSKYDITSTKLLTLFQNNETIKVQYDDLDPQAVTLNIIKSSASSTESSSSSNKKPKLIQNCMVTSVNFSIDKNTQIAANQDPEDVYSINTTGGLTGSYNNYRLAVSNIENKKDEIALILTPEVLARMITISSREDGFIECRDSENKLICALHTREVKDLQIN